MSAEYEYTLIIYPPSVELGPYKRNLDEVLRNSISIYGKELPEEFGALNFLIVPKDKELNVLRTLLLLIKVNVFCCNIDTNSLDNKIRMEAMNCFFENFTFGGKPLKQRVKKIIEEDMQIAREDSVRYDALSTLIPRINKTFDEIKEKDITDDKTFSTNLDDEYAVPPDEFRKLKRPIRKRIIR